MTCRRSFWVLVLYTGLNSLNGVAARVRVTRVEEGSHSTASSAEQAPLLRTARVSVGPGGAQADDNSFGVSISADGSVVSFTSWASTLVAGDTNKRQVGPPAFNFFYGEDVFVYDRPNGETTRVSVGSQGQQGVDGNSGYGALSADGRFVAFTSWYPNLVAEFGDGHGDILVHDRLTRETVEVSRELPNTSQYDYLTYDPSMSADGRFVAFSSGSQYLVIDDVNGAIDDVFVYDRQLETTEMASRVDDPQQGFPWSGFPSISGDGRYVAFMSASSALVAGDTNGLEDVFVRDRMTSQTFRVSVDSQGGQSNERSSLPSISPDAHCVVFLSRPAGCAGRCEHVLLHDLQSGETHRITNDPATGLSSWNALITPTVSNGCRFVTFSSDSPNLVEGDTNDTWDVFLHDRETDVTTRVSVNDYGDGGNNSSAGSVISADGRFVAFFSYASNLVAGDTNGVSDVFVRGPFDAPPPAPALIFAQFVDGGGAVAGSQQPQADTASRSRIILVNNSDQPDKGVILFQSGNGEPLLVPVKGKLVRSDGSLPYSLDPWASLDVQTTGFGPLKSGVIRVFSERGGDSQIEGTETFEIQGTFVSVGSSPLLEEALSYVSVDDSELTGVAFYNPDQQRTLTLTLMLRDELGAERSSKVLEVGPDRSLVGFVTEPDFFADFFDSVETPFRGVLDLRSEEGRAFTVLGLVQKLDSGALIGSPLVESSDSPGHLIFPHFVDGEYFDQGETLTTRTRIVLLDPVDDQGLITFRNAMGLESPIQIGSEYASSVPFDTPSGGASEFRSEGSGELQSGTVEILSDLGTDSKLIAWEALEVGRDFVTVSSARLSGCQQTYVSVDGNNEDTGVALFNPSETAELSLDLLLVDEKGTRRALRNLHLLPRRQAVAFVTQEAFFREFLSGMGNVFQGTLNIRSNDGSPFALLGILRRASGALIGVTPSLNAYKKCTEFELE